LYSGEHGKEAAQFVTQTKTVSFEPPEMPVSSLASQQARKAEGQMSASCSPVGRLRG
jgi:hypothetical protein